MSLDSSEHELLPSVYTRQTKRTTANAKAEDERIERILKEHVYDKIVPMIVNIDTQVRQIKSQMEDFSNQIQQIQEHLSSKVGDEKKSYLKVYLRRLVLGTSVSLILPLKD